MDLIKAVNLADRIIETMTPFCERVQVAGSIRRHKPEVKDIEICAIPTLGEPSDLLGEQRENLLYQWAQRMEAENRIHWIKPGTDEVIRWQINPDGKYWRGWCVQAQVKLDLFLANQANFGAILLIRTGPAEYSRKIVTVARYQCGMAFEGGYLTDEAGERVSTPEEVDVYRALNIPFVKPEDRKA